MCVDIFILLMFLVDFDTHFDYIFGSQKVYTFGYTFSGQNAQQLLHLLVHIWLHFW